MKSKQQDFRTEKYIRYGIRKYSFGAASVAIAAGLMMFLGNGAVSAAEVQGADATAATTTTPVATKESESTITAEKSEAKASEKVVETKKVDKTALTKKVVELEAKIASAKKADATEIATANEVLTAAKAVLANETAKQADIDAELAKVEALITVVVESDEAGKQVEETAATTAVKPVATTATEKAVEESKKVLEQVTSEAEVTNVLADEAVRRNKVEGANKAAIEAAVANNKAIITETKKVLAAENVTAQQINTQLSRLNESILAVYNDLKKAGIGRDGKFGVSLAASNYYATENPKADGTRDTTATTVNADTATGKDVYTFTATGATSQDVETSKIKGDITTLKMVVGSTQRTGEETNPGNGQTTENNGKDGHNNKGRIDYPLTDEMAKKIAAEAPLWKGKLRPDGSRISTNPTSVYSANGGYEYLATHIYGLAYEQGVDRVYIPKIKERFGVTADAKAAGWEITSVNPTNLPPGLVYDKQSDTIQGKIVSNSLPNGVYDMRTYVTATNSKTGATVTALFRNLRAGWIGWQDTTKPEINIAGESYKKTVGDDINIDIKYRDPSGSRPSGNGTYSETTYTLADGRKVTIRNVYGTSTTGVDGTLISGGIKSDTTVQTSIPGVNYTVKNWGTTQHNSDNEVTGRDGNGVLNGKVTTAGVYYTTVYAKDWNINNTSTDAWKAQGQESQAGVTLTVAPKVQALNIETYSTTLPLTISKGATGATITMPDGSVTVLENRNGKWVVAAGTTNSAVSVGDVLGNVGDQINLKVTSAATAKAGVDNINVSAKTENVQAVMMRNQVTLKAKDNTTHIAKLSETTGRWELPADYATVKKVNNDGTYTETKREVYTKIQADGSARFYIYEYNRTFDANGTVTAVGDVTLTETIYSKENTDKSTTGNGLYVTVNYDKATDTWTASDGSTVTAEKKGDNEWHVKTSSGYSAVVKGRIGENSDKASIINSKPTATSTSYESTKGTSVDLRNAPEAGVMIADKEDDANNKTTYITRITVTSPSGVKKVYDTKQDAKNYTLASNYKLTEVGTYTVTVEVIDSNGNYVEATLNGTDSGTDAGSNSSVASTTYTITVKDTIQGHNVTSTGVQGATQTGTPTFTSVGDGSPVTPGIEYPAKFVDPSTGSVTNSPELDAMKDGKKVGTYTLDPVNGVVTFKPNKDFVGTPDPVTLSLTAKLGQDKDGKPITSTATATYTPTVTPVKPTATPAVSKDIQGATQTGTPTFKEGDKVAPIKDGSIKLLDKDGKEVPAGQTTPAYAEDGKEIGTYSVDAKTGTVTFTPKDKMYTGKVKPARVQAEDANGTKVETTYTPEIVPVTPTATPATSQGIQGAKQTGKPEFKGGTATVNGTEKTVPINEVVPAKLVDPNTGKLVDSVTVPGEGTYTVAPDGTVTFTPEKTFTGVAKGVEVLRQDLNGTPVKATYTPEVKPATPTGVDTITEDIQGATQTGKPEFKSGTVTINGKEETVPMDDNVPATFEDGKTEKVVPGEGKYTVAKDGTVTFVPEKAFTGKATTVTVVRVDTNGTKANAKYTPVVVPVTPTSTDAESEGPKGQTQTGTPTFAGGKAKVNGVEKTVEIDETVKPTFDDGTTKKVVPGEGTYTIDENGKVTFTPEKDFVGKAAGVIVKRVDKNGTEITAKYTPTVRPETSFVDTRGNVLAPSEDGEQPKKDIPGYRFVETKKLPNGDIEHVYEKVKTSHKDKEGNEIPGYPTEDGEQPKKDIPGYRFVETKKLPNGDIEHVYEKVVAAPQQKPAKQSPATKAAKGLPNTGTEDHSSLAALGLLGVLSGFGLVASKKKED